MTIQPITPLRQRMIEDMTIRRLKERTQDFYQRAVAKYAQHFHRSPGELDYQHVRQYQLHLVQSGWQPGYLNRTMSALRFFYKVTMGRQDALEMIPLVPEPPRKLRQVLTPEEVVRLIEAAPSGKYRCAFSVAYGAGLRSSEVVSLTVSDIDSTRMVLRIEDGKGSKDRLAKLSPLMLRELRAWWESPSPRPSCFRARSNRPIISLPGNTTVPAAFGPRLSRRAIGQSRSWQPEGRARAVFADVLRRARPADR
jgi:integrase/recombinase XerD